MKGRKWKDSGVPLVALDCLNASMGLYGGVWDMQIGKFMNKAWVYSQQYRYILACLKSERFHYPHRVVEEARTLDGCYYYKKGGAK